ncbi:MAG: peptidoglycan bridge formation glycyltransferase FemA/FemB family protein [Elusimicrobia bacterium]|nr:peptidoglycan bridge formation glycyltransferase FemA/FemB family protein [Elusimicrobiota bacterium]
MVTWRLLPDDFPAATWDDAVSSLPGHSIFQSAAWAEHKSRFGWTPLRLAAGSESRPEAAVQFLCRRRAFGTLLWSRGGPVGMPEAWGQGLLGELRRSAGSPLAYARVCSYQILDERSARAMESGGWKRPVKPLNRNATFLLDIAHSADALRKCLSSNWSHNLRRSEKRCAPPRRWESPDTKELIRVYRSMEGYKGMRPQYGERELQSLLGALAGSIILYRADDERGAPLALRACAAQKDKAWDLLAASSEAGRRCYASYALLWALLRECMARGVREFDLGGADPVEAKGVHDFKKGTGARFVEYLGEWDWASPSWLRVPASALAGLRAGL